MVKIVFFWFLQIARSSKEDEGRSALKLESQEEERKPALTPTEFSALLPASSQLNRPTNRQARYILYIFFANLLFFLFLWFKET